MKKIVKNKMLSDTTMKSRVNAAYEKYVKRFLSEWKKEDSYRPDCYGDDTCDDESGEQFVQDQIKFICQYLGFMLLAGPHQENLNRIQYFLDMQGAIKSQDKIEIRFLSGDPHEVYVYVDSLNDIDLADVYQITFYNCLLITREGGKKWTKRIVKEFVEEVRSDLEYDGDEVSLSYEIMDKTLAISCDFSNY